jgi:hypothetical protein
MPCRVLTCLYVYVYVWCAMVRPEYRLELWTCTKDTSINNDIKLRLLKVTDSTALEACPLQVTVVLWDPL